MQLAVTWNLWNNTVCHTIPHNCSSTLNKHFWINSLTWLHKKPAAMMRGTKSFAPLGAKELDCTTRWDLSTALEHHNDALWEHLLPCLFSGCWSLLKRETRAWMMAISTHTASIYLTACTTRSPCAGFTCFSQSGVRETKGVCSLAGQQTKLSIAAQGDPQDPDMR